MDDSRIFDHLENAETYDAYVDEVPIVCVCSSGFYSGRRIGYYREMILTKEFIESPGSVSLLHQMIEVPEEFRLNGFKFERIAIS